MADYNFRLRKHYTLGSHTIHCSATFSPPAARHRRSKRPIVTINSNTAIAATTGHSMDNRGTKTTRGGQADADADTDSEYDIQGASQVEEKPEEAQRRARISRQVGFQV